MKDKKKEVIYFISPRWKIIELRLSNLNFDNLSKKDKEEALNRKEEIEKQLHANKILGVVTLTIYTMLYFSVISFVLSFSNLVSFFSSIINIIVNLIGAPILVVIAYFLNRNMTNRYDDIHISMMKIIAKIEKAKK